MLNKLSFDSKSYVYSKRKKLNRNKIIKSKRRYLLSLIVSLSIITMFSFYFTHNIYIHINSKDLQFAAEYNFTTGFSPENKILRVQNMSLIYCDGETSVIEASGLTKTSPHKKVTIKGIFKKDAYKSWHLEKMLT